ncbi:hypothetical protein AB0D11_41635 [Streptomyces monashensis]|uniref:hypothetical protein n=1 Tax=Streptomyces monashensis TaxID=1678012 RepID=UPI0033E3F896
MTGAVEVARVEPILRCLSDAGAGLTAQARLLALLLTVRRCPSGTAWLTLDDLRPGHAGMSEAAVRDLRSGGWLQSPAPTPTSGTPTMPCLLAEDRLSREARLPWHVRQSLQSWIEQVITHRLLLGWPADVRLAALYLTARGRPGHTGEVSLRMLARLCCCHSPEGSEHVLRALQDSGWLRMLHINRGWKRPATYQLAAVGQDLLPRSAPGAPHRGSAEIKVAGKEKELAAWAHAYHQRHGHPPALLEVLAAHHAPVPVPVTAWGIGQLQKTAAQLQSTGWLHVGPSEGQLVQPGPQYWQRPAPPKRRKRHALSPRIEATRKAPTGRMGWPPGPENPSTQGRDPELACRRRAPVVPASGRPAVPKGIWLIPGAHAILRPDDA